MPLTAAPAGRKKVAPGKEQGGSGVPPLNQPKQQRRDAAATLGHETQNTLGTEGVKADGDLPAGWTEQRIEQLFAPLEDGRLLHQGWSPQCDKVPSPSEDVWGVLKTTSIQAGEFQPEHNKLLPSGLEPRPLIEVKEGDILITCAGPRVRCGVSCLVRQTRKRLMMSGKMYRFRVDADRTDPRYLEAFLQTERARLAIDKMKTGSSDSGLNLTHDRFRQLPIPVVPLPEQRRIVAEIEKQFTRLEAGVAALRRVQANLKRYRAAVLKAACEGRLVPTEAELARVGRVPTRGVRPNAKNAASGDAAYNAAPYETGEQLLQRILTERRQNWQGRGQYKEPAAPDTTNLPPLPEGWAWASLEQMLIYLRNGWGFKPDAEAGTPILRISALRPMSVNLDDVRYLSGPADDYAEYILTQGDLLFTRYNGNPNLTGVCGVVPPLTRTVVHPDKLIRVRLIPKLCVPSFVGMVANVGASRDFLAARSRTTAGQTGISGSDLRAIPIPLPPLAEQARIVAEVERRLSVVEEMEAVVSANLQRATRLRQSILQKAFTGKLTYQDL